MEQREKHQLLPEIEREDTRTRERRNLPATSRTTGNCNY